MTLKQAAEPSAAQQQMDMYNKANKTLVQRADFLPDAGAAWAVVGGVLAGVVVPGNEATLVAGLEAKPEITSVMDPRFWMPTPAEILINPEAPAPATHESLIGIWSHTTYQKGWGGDKTDKKEDDYEEVRPPTGKNALIFAVVLPAELSTAQMVVDLETAVKAVAGFLNAEHLLDGVIPTNATGIKMELMVATRIKPIEA